MEKEEKIHCRRCRNAGGGGQGKHKRQDGHNSPTEGTTNQSQDLNENWGGCPRSNEEKVEMRLKVIGIGALFRGHDPRIHLKKKGGVN